MRKFFYLFFFPLIIYSQQFEIIDDIPRDTSFNIKSQEIKIKQLYPDAKLVESNLPEGVTLHKNLIYKSIGKRSLHLDIFEPGINIEKKKIGILIIHGGGWRSGNKTMEWPTAINLASKGFVAATVEYRLSPEALYPAGIFDLKAAIIWMKKNAAKLKIDTNKIAVSGCSAGGELAAFLGTTGSIEKFDDGFENNKFSSKVNAVIDVDGILDFTHPAESDKDIDPEKPSAGKAWFGVSYNENPVLWIEASPINYVNKNTPPICFINSSNERYHAGRDYMIEKMNHFEIYSEVHTINSTPHPFWLFHPWFDEFIQYVEIFLNRVFNK